MQPRKKTIKTICFFLVFFPIFLGFTDILESHFFAIVNGKSDKYYQFENKDSIGLAKYTIFVDGTFRCEILNYHLMNGCYYSSGSWKAFGDSIWLSSESNRFFDDLNQDYLLNEPYMYKYRSVCKLFIKKNDSIFHLENCVTGENEESVDEKLLKQANSNKIVSPLDGIVVDVIKMKDGYLGIGINHLNYSTYYERLDSVVVRKGQFIKKKEVIGYQSSPKEYIVDIVDR